MGLLSHITNSETCKHQVLPQQKSGSGLLARAQQSLEKEYFSIQNWAKENNFAHCGFFSSVNGIMAITNAYGLDSQTIINSISSKDFWQGTFSNNSVLNYSKHDKEIYNFLQFFSFDLKNSIEHICFIKLPLENDFAIFMTFNTDENELCISKKIIDNINFIATTNKIGKNYFNFSSLVPQNYYLYTIDYFEIFQNSINVNQFPNENVKNAIINCIDSQIYNFFKSALPEPAIVFFRKPNRIYLALKTKILDKDLFLTHINFIFKNIFGQSASIKNLPEFKNPNDLTELKNLLEK